MRSRTAKATTSLERSQQRRQYHLQRATPQRHLACGRNRQPLATGAITPRALRQSFQQNSPLPPLPSERTKKRASTLDVDGYDGMAPTHLQSPTSHRQDYYLRITKRDGRWPARPRRISPISQTWRTGSCARLAILPHLSCRLHAVMRSGTTDSGKHIMEIIDRVRRLRARWIAHHSHYPNSQAHHAQAFQAALLLVERDRQPPRESNMSRNFPSLMLISMFDMSPAAAVLALVQSLQTTNRVFTLSPSKDSASIGPPEHVRSFARSS